MGPSPAGEGPTPRRCGCQALEMAISGSMGELAAALLFSAEERSCHESAEKLLRRSTRLIARGSVRPPEIAAERRSMNDVDGGQCPGTDVMETGTDAATREAGCYTWVRTR